MALSSLAAQRLFPKLCRLQRGKAAQARRKEVFLVCRLRARHRRELVGL
jgi:hypothetical protein